MNRSIETRQYRNIRVFPGDGNRQASLDEENRIVRDVSVSSGEPYEQWYGDEILLHGPANVDLSRIEQNAAPLLFNHDRNQFLGKVTNPRLKDGKLYVDLKFSQSDDAMRALVDLRDGLATEMSIGYEVNKFEVDEDKETYTATRWTIYEISVVTVPADFTVGVGRSAEPALTTRQMNTTTAPTDRTNNDNPRTATQERERITGIRAIAKLPNIRRFVSEDDVDKAINEGWSKKAFQTFAIERMGDTPECIVTDGDDPRRGAGRHGNRTVAAQIVGHRDFRKIRDGGQQKVVFNLPGVRSAREILERSITLTTDTAAPVMTLPSVQGVAFERLVVADLLAQGTTDTGLIAYPRENSFSSNAGTVGQAGLKPEQTIDIVPDQAKAKKIAAWTQISDELLDDTPASEAYIQTRLGFAVLKAEDNQLLNGSGLNNDIKGIRSFAGVQAQALGSDTIPDAIRKAIRNVEETTDFFVSGIVVNIHDWATIEMLKDTLGRYIVGQITVPDEFGRPRLAPALWSRPVAVSKSLPQGTALVGAYNAAAQIFRRQGLTIAMSNSDRDNFVRNLITILAELRAALAVYAPSAFCEVTGIPA